MINMLGSTVYYEIEKFEECITDSDKALELNKSFIKVINCYKYVSLMLSSLSILWEPKAIP